MTNKETKSAAPAEPISQNKYETHGHLPECLYWTDDEACDCAWKGFPKIAGSLKGLFAAPVEPKVADPEAQQFFAWWDQHWPDLAPTHQALQAYLVGKGAKERGEYIDLQLVEDALFMAAAVDADSERAGRMRELGERIYKLKKDHYEIEPAKPASGLRTGEPPRECENYDHRFIQNLSGTRKCCTKCGLFIELGEYGFVDREFLTDAALASAPATRPLPRELASRIGTLADEAWRIGKAYGSENTVEDCKKLSTELHNLRRELASESTSLPLSAVPSEEKLKCGHHVSLKQIINNEEYCELCYRMHCIQNLEQENQRFLNILKDM